MTHNTIIGKLKLSKDFNECKNFAASLPNSFDSEGRTIYNERNIVKEMTVDGMTLIVKKFHRPNIIQRVAYTFFKRSKAERAFDFARRMRQSGIDTPQEVACVETLHNRLLDESFFVSTPCWLPPLSTLLRRPDFDKNVADDLAAFVVKLHELGIMHGDLNLTNILYEQDADGHTRFTLIDTNRSRFGTNLTRQQCIGNIMRLSHDRPLLEHIVRRYAYLRHWNPDKTSCEVMHTLERFEKRRELKKRIKRFFRKQK